MKPYLSFSIGSYNRKDCTVELVRELLSSNEDAFEVLVVDNCSSDGTVEELMKIHDNRLRVYINEKEHNGKQTWFDAYERANGEWIFYINDRDWVDASYISRLINVLKELEEKNVGFAVAREKVEQNPLNDYVIFDEGFQTIREFGLRDQHPTGQIIRKDCWLQIEDRRLYFAKDEYGIYPHGFIEAIIGNKYKGAYILFDICDKLHASERIRKISPSGMYKNARGTEFFWPHKRYELIELFVKNIGLVEDETKWKDLVFHAYKRFFMLSTIAYNIDCHDEELKRRYGYPNLQTSDQEIFEIGLNYICMFRRFLAINEPEWMKESFYFELESIETQLLGQLSRWIDLRKFAKDVRNYEGRVIIFGAGQYGSEALKEIGSEKIICFCDNNPRKWGQTMEGKTIYSLQESLEIAGEKVLFVISPRDLEISISIANQLKELGCDYQFRL